MKVILSIFLIAFLALSACSTGEASKVAEDNSLQIPVKNLKADNTVTADGEPSTSGSGGGSVPAYTISLYKYAAVREYNSLTDEYTPGTSVYATAMLMARPYYPEVPSKMDIECHENLNPWSNYFYLNGEAEGIPYNNSMYDTMSVSAMSTGYKEGTPLDCHAAFFSQDPEVDDLFWEEFELNPNGSRFADIKQVTPVLEIGTNRLLVYVDIESLDLTMSSVSLNIGARTSNGWRDEFHTLGTGITEFKGIVPTNITVDSTVQSIDVNLNMNTMESVNTYGYGYWEVGTKSSVVIDGTTYPSKFAASSVPEDQKAERQIFEEIIEG